jgi:hypothetical protein
MRSGLELARSPSATLAYGREARSRAALALGMFGFAAIPLVLAMLPLLTLLWLVGAGASCALLASIPWPRGDEAVLPEDIADPGLRSTYRAILAARSELELALANAPGFVKAASSLARRCNDAVCMCGRIATVANRLHAFLSAHDASEIARETAQLRARATSTHDEATARSLEQAAAACEQQLAACEELTRARERIQSRLDHVLASLRALTAVVVKQQTAEDEQLALADDSSAEHVDSVRQELGVLESALQLEAA